MHRRPVFIYLLNVPSFSSRYFNKIKRTSRLGRLLALSLEILYLLSQAAAPYCNIYLGNSSKIGFVFRVNIILKNLTLKILFFIFISWAMMIIYLRKKLSKWGLRNTHLLGGPKTPFQYTCIACIILYKTLRSYNSCHFNNSILLVYVSEVIQH